MRILLSLVLSGSLFLSAFARKQEPPLLREIARHKAAGQPYGGDLWHAAEAEYRAQVENSAHFIASRPPRLDDGGATWQTATEISANPYSDVGTTVGKGNEGLIPQCLTGGEDTAEDAWYRLQVSDSIIAAFWITCESSGPPSYDTRLGLFNQNLALIACNDDAEDCGDPYYQSRIESVPLLPGTYYICVDGYDGDSGPYIFNAAWEIGVPCNGLGSIPQNPFVVNTLPYFHQGSTVDQCDDRRIICEAGGSNTAPDTWYRVTLDVPVLLDAWTECGAQWFDTKLAIFDDQLIQIDCNDDDPTCMNGQSRLDNVALPNGTFYVVVDGYADAEGAYALHIDTTHYDPSGATEWAPDITIRASDLYDTELDTDIIPGHRHLRLSNGTPNDGLGKLYLYGVFPPNGDGTQDVRQRIYRSDGSFYDRPSGRFIFHAEHDHIHLEDWCIYRLRSVNQDGSPGPIVAEGEKTSFCIMDLAIFNRDNPNFDSDGQFLSCASTVQGISAGWVDIYHKELEGQYIDITGLPDGEYWLEAEADPDNHIYEADETNNINRVLVNVGDGATVPDAYEPNNTIDQVLAQPVGGATSPNLGPCNPELVIPNLTIHQPGDEDLYRFYINSTGTGADYIRLEFENDQGNLGIQLLDPSGHILQTVNGNSNEEFLFLTNRAAGWYFAKAFSSLDTLGQVYTLTINPPANNPPSVLVLNPPAGNIVLQHGQDAYTCTWEHSDPENDPQWVTIWMNSTPDLNGAFVLTSSLNTPAELGFAVMNSAYFAPGTYYVHAAITDGGTTTGDWSAGTVTWLGEKVHEHPGGHIPAEFYLAQNFPNPFNPNTTIRFGIAREGQVTLRVFNIQGEQVATLLRETLKPGQYSIPFAATQLGSGMYIYSLSTADKLLSQKMLLLK